MPTFGNTGAGTQDNNFLEGTTFGSSAVLSEDGVLTKISCLVIGAPNLTNYFGVIYADSAGLPGARLAQAPGRALSATGWQDSTFTTPVALAAGTYWLCIAAGGTTFSARGDSNTAFSQEKAAISPDPFGTPTASFEGPSCIYATYNTAVQAPVEFPPRHFGPF